MKYFLKITAAALFVSGFFFLLGVTWYLALLPLYVHLIFSLSAYLMNKRNEAREMVRHKMIMRKVRRNYGNKHGRLTFHARKRLRDHLHSGGKIHLN